MSKPNRKRELETRMTQRRKQGAPKEVQAAPQPNTFLAIVMEPGAPMEVLNVPQEDQEAIMSIYKKHGQYSVHRNKGRTVEMNMPYAMIILEQKDAAVYEPPADTANVVPSEGQQEGASNGGLQ